MKSLRNTTSTFLINLIHTCSQKIPLGLLADPLQHLLSLQPEAMCLGILSSTLLLSEIVLNWSDTHTILV